MFIWFIFGAMCMLVVLLILAYLKFVSLNKAAANAWQKLDFNMKNRAELIPSLALAAAAFEELDRTFVYELSALKDTCRRAASLQERVKCENEITKKFKKVFTAAMHHPETEQNEHFLKLRENIIQAESKVQRSKKKYNSAARDFNTIASIIPLNLIAQMFEFKPYEYFDFDPSVDNNIKK
ncbi:MAG: LemA family protein [Elusimicrobia bacterium]|nr:LemA family protein [Elusimicrobiota bacterium]